MNSKKKKLNSQSVEHTKVEQNKNIIFVCEKKKINKNKFTKNNNKFTYYKSPVWVIRLKKITKNVKKKTIKTFKYCNLFKLDKWRNSNNSKQASTN